MRIPVAVTLCLGGVAAYVASYHLWWPLVFVALAPVAAALRGVKHDGAAAVLAFITGWAAMFFVAHTMWVFSASAVAVLAAYQALTWIPIALAVRGAGRRWGIGLTWSWPAAWTAGECLRLIGPLGTPFGALYVPCAVTPLLLQIGELGGMQLASFPIAMAHGWAADALSRRFGQGGHVSADGAPGGWRGRRGAAVATVSVWIAVLVFGWVRYGQIERGLRPGPRVAVIQPDIPHLVGEPPGYHPTLLREKLQHLSEEAVAQGGPVHLVVWPEGIAEFPLRNRAFLEAEYDPRMNEALGVESADPGEGAARWEEALREAKRDEAAFADWVRQLGVPVLVGMTAFVPAPPDREEPFLKLNAAVRFDPGRGQLADLQAKVRLYPGGEFAPWRGTFLERILGGSSGDFTPGDVRHVYTADAEGARYIVRICSEMKFSKLSGRLEGGEDFDFIVSPANEGMFQRNRAQVLLRDCAVYRSIERRVGVVRAGNSGTSGFAAPSGRVYGQVTNVLGQTRTGLGAPELPLIRELVRFRGRHETEFATNKTLRAELERRIAEVNEARARAGIEGWSVRQVMVCDVRTVFERFGDWSGPVFIGLLALMNLVVIGSRQDREGKRGVNVHARPPKPNLLSLP